jgi:hypothetical protein
MDLKEAIVMFLILIGIPLLILGVYELGVWLVDVITSLF